MIEPAYCALEFHDEPAGIVIRQDHGYVFHATADWAWPLEGSRHPSLAAAERAIFVLWQKPLAVDPTSGIIRDSAVLESQSGGHHP